MDQTLATSAARIRMPIIVMGAAAAAFLALGTAASTAQAASVAAVSTVEQGLGDPWDITPPTPTPTPTPTPNPGDPWDSAPADPGSLVGYGDPWD